MADLLVEGGAAPSRHFGSAATFFQTIAEPAMAADVYVMEVAGQAAGEPADLAAALLAQQEPPGRRIAGPGKYPGIQRPVGLGHGAAELVSARLRFRPRGQGVLDVRVELVDQLGQVIPLLWRRQASPLARALVKRLRHRCSDDVRSWHASCRRRPRRAWRQRDEQRLSLDAQFVPASARSGAAAHGRCGAVRFPSRAAASGRLRPRTSAMHQPSRSAVTTVAASPGTAMAPSCPVGRPDGNARPCGTSPGTPHRIARQSMPSRE